MFMLEMFFIKSCLICNKLFRYCFVKADQNHNKLFGFICFVEVVPTIIYCWANVLWKLIKLRKYISWVEFWESNDNKLLGLCFADP